MIELLSPRQIDQMRPAGRFVADVLQDLRARVEPGVNLLDIDGWAAEMIRRRNAVSCYVDYAPSFGRGPFGKVICTSVNDAVLHGLPHDYPLRDGDLLTLDFAAEVDGWVCDSAISFVVGDGGGPADEHLIDTTRAALDAAIPVCAPGNRLGDVSATIGGVLTGAGYEVNTEFGGHGVGRTMHQDPHVANIGRAGRGLSLRPGLVIAVEPWVMIGTKTLTVDPDGWTLRSANHERTAHHEHTIAVTEDGPVVLTLPGQ
ncbi:type I methionyl aminopeptidase [Actinocatenispora rupis]|uniref:Methionine aminopeptidase n=1 Tax=Actinocatenispora rupis TaxID=519421 RepID=A0A8J3J4P3_9ACTN|nr:type I methionyl aminopeptidase [Actinocatenispora rupis]GID11912.1 methionine aminopeptidase [Actinocatenispora rupis]